MAVDYDYYRKLEEEYYALFKKYDDMKLGDKLQELKPFEKRYEVIPKYVKFAPHAGRYDHFFYQGLGKRKYKPAKKLFPELPNVTNDVYEYNYKNDKIVFVRGWEYSVDDEELWCATSCYCITNEGYVRVNERTKVTEEIFLIEKQEHSTEYLCLWRPLLGTPTFTQFIVPDEGDYYDEYRVGLNDCIHTRYFSDDRIDYQDSKFVEVQEGEKADEESHCFSEANGYQKVIVPERSSSPSEADIATAKVIQKFLNSFFDKYKGLIIKK